jgi:quercetin dioxygenase-like cupin family protein/DNA-binding Xre family transcriptional regulator
MSVRDVAAKAHCSSSLISQIEQERVSPSIRTAERICAALELSLSDFLRIEPIIEHPIQISTERTDCEIVVEWPTARIRNLLNAEIRAGFTALSLQLDPGGITPFRRAPQLAKDFCIVIAGEVCCKVGSEDYKLSAGETFHFDATNPHQWINQSSGHSAEVILTSPVGFKLFEDVERSLRLSEEAKIRKKRRSLESTAS